MDLKLKRILLAVALATLVVFYFFIKLNNHFWVETWFAEGRFALLNKISAVDGQQSLDFYLGRSQEILWGPLLAFLSGLILVGLALPFFPPISPLSYGFLIFLFLLLTKWEVLAFPPYGDAIGGPFAEALWLKQHNFDFAGLAKEDGYINGGPKVYFFTIYPAFLALLMKLIPSVRWFLAVNHLLVFAMAASIVATARQIFLKVFPPRTALLSSLVILSLPLFQSQCEAINMEMPGLFFSVLSMAALASRNFRRASVLAVLALLSKDTGIITCMTVVVGSVGLFFLEEKKVRLAVFFWGIFLPVFFIGLKLIAAFWVTYGHAPAGGRVGWAAGWPSIKSMPVLWLYVASVIVFFLDLFRRQKESTGSWGSRISVVSREDLSAVVMFLFAGIWFAFFLNFFAVSYRYRLLLVPFLVFCVIFSWTRFIKMERPTVILLVAVILFSFFGSYGYLYGSMLENDHVLLERSLEYRNDLFVNMKMAKDLESNFEGATLGAPFVLAQILALPELGYVQKKLDVVIYGMRCTYGGIRNYEGFHGLNIKKTVWVGVRTFVFGDMPYPIDEKDRIIKEFEVGNKKISLFVGGVAIERMRLRLNYMSALKEKARTMQQP